MADLVAKFENSLGRKHKLRVKKANTDIEPEKIRASLEKLTTVDLFRNKKDARLFDKVITASFFEEFDRIIFDNSSDEVIEIDMTNAAPVNEHVVVSEQPKPSFKEFKLTVIEEKMVEPTVLKQVLELPLGFKLNHLFQEQKRALIVSKVPEGGKPIEANIHNEENPVRIELLVQLKEEIEEKANASPPQDQREKQSLWDRLKKRRWLE